MIDTNQTKCNCSTHVRPRNALALLLQHFLQQVTQWWKLNKLKFKSSMRWNEKRDLPNDRTKMDLSQHKFLNRRRRSIHLQKSSNMVKFMQWTVFGECRCDKYCNVLFTPFGDAFQVSHDVYLLFVIIFYLYIPMSLLSVFNSTLDLLLLLLFWVHI